MRILPLILIFLIGLTLLSCQRNTNPLEPDSERSTGLQCAKYENFREKIIDGQICRISYSEKIPSSTGWETAPENIRIKAKNYLINQTSESFFNSWFQLRSAEIIPVDARSQVQDECYVVSWYFDIQISDYATYRTAACYLDSAGNIIRDEGITGLASIKDTITPFTVTDTVAIKTAMQFGLDPGISSWNVSFYYYHSNLQKYVWSVTNFIDEYSGTSLIIDSNRPEVLKSDIWILVAGGGW